MEEGKEITKKDRERRRRRRKRRKKKKAEPRVKRTREEWMATNYISSLRLNNYVNQQATVGVELICAVFLDFQQRESCFSS